MRLLLRTLGFATCVLAHAAYAGDWYVDSINGSDANGGSGPTDAWRTLTHAVASTPGPYSIETIHIAPGTYDAALGETFPLAMVPAQQLVVAPGVGPVIVDGGHVASALIEIDSDPYGGYIFFDQNTLVRGLTLRNADRGVIVSSSWSACPPTLEDLVVQGMSSAGIAYWGGANADATGVLRRTTIESCATAIEIRAVGAVSPLSQGSATPTLEDCVIRANSGDGVLLQTTLLGRALPTFRRTRIVANAQDGVRAEYVPSTFGSTIDASFEDCLIAENGGDAFDGASSSSTGAAELHATFRRCTLVQNGGVGVRAVEANWQQDHATVLDSTIVARNGDDILENGTVTATACTIEDGDFAGQNGNFGGDPQFADPGSGDWRLRWGSPCIESASAVLAGTLDLLGHARRIDGNLDTLQAPDRGAFEFEPLHLESTGQLGSTLKLELWGPQGNASTVYFARFALAAPQATPFGEFELAPNFAVFRVTVAGSGPPKKIVRTIPNLPGLIGSTYSFQALTSSSAAPQGAAYTNGVELTFLP